MSDTVLIVDDDAAVSKMLAKVMRTNSLDSEIASSGEEAIEMLRRRSYSLMLLDVNMHEMDGFEVLETIRRQGNRMPVIIISGRKDDYDTIYGLDIGADEYITKPFNPVTLGTRVKALLRRAGTGASDSSVITAGPFSYNTSTLRFYKNGKEIVLTGKENAIMKLFLDNINRVFPKELLYDMVWGNDTSDDNVVMVYINHLRQKIEDCPDEPKYIQTLRGIGYRFVV